MRIKETNVSSIRLLLDYDNTMIQYTVYQKGDDNWSNTIDAKIRIPNHEINNVIEGLHQLVNEFKKIKETKEV